MHERIGSALGLETIANTPLSFDQYNRKNHDDHRVAYERKAEGWYLSSVQYLYPEQKEQILACESLARGCWLQLGSRLCRVANS